MSRTDKYSNALSEVGEPLPQPRPEPNMIHEKTPEERAAIVVWHLAHGDSLRSAEAARLTGLTREGARDLLNRISRVIPIYQEDGQRWQVLAMREAE